MIELLPLLTILIASLIVALFYLLKERSNDKRKLEQLQNATTELAKQVWFYFIPIYYNPIIIFHRLKQKKKEEK